jgi:hypothetical protein
MTQGNQPGIDEMYCTSCGSIVKIRAELCMKCGVRVSGPGMAVPSSTANRTPTRLLATWPSMVGERRELPPPSMLFAALIALSGSVFAIPGIFQAELTAIGPLAAWVWAPVIEEMFKPAGVYLILVRWPGTLKSRAVTALLTALAGMTFALIESTIYMKVYFPEHTQDDLVFRYTVPVLIHTLASFIFGLGLNQQLVASLRRGGPFLASNWGFFLAAIVVHSVYNITVTVLEMMGTI